MADLQRNAAGRGRAARLLAEIDALDKAICQAIADTPTPVLDPAMRWLTRAASYSRLSLAISAALSVAGGRRGRQTSLRALMAVATTSLAVNLIAKLRFPRQRPAPIADQPGRTVKAPASSSFPSGHSATAFAFATVVSQDDPLLSLPVTALAVAVGYSRIHTGAHYPSDVIAGGLVGTAIASVVAALLPRPART
jgi:undecaprenyl-diphosphatase